MLAWHFVPLEFGLSNLRHRRLKIAILDDLNDPFELFSLDLSNSELRTTFEQLKTELARKHGLVCFSRSFHNPVLWSHYADRHRGIALGFEIADALPVEYTRHRLVSEAEAVLRNGGLDQAMLLHFLRTKYAHWRYENELRCVVPLPPPDAKSGMHFLDFGENLRPVAVVVGAESSLDRGTLVAALGDLAPAIRICKARLAFRTFRVVRQRTPWV